MPHLFRHIYDTHPVSSHLRNAARRVPAGFNILPDPSRLLPYRPNHGVQFVNKQNHLPFLLCKIIQNGFQTFFKFTAKLGAGNQCAISRANTCLPLMPSGTSPLTIRCANLQQ